MILNNLILHKINNYLDSCDKYVFFGLSKSILYEYRSVNNLVIKISDFFIRYYLHNYTKIVQLSIIIDWTDIQLIYYICKCKFNNLKKVSFNVDYSIFKQRNINNAIILEYTLLNKYLKIFFSNHINLVDISIQNSYSLKDSTILLIYNKCKELKNINLDNCIGLTSLSKKI